jgi:glucosylceramidase
MTSYMRRSYYVAAVVVALVVAVIAFGWPAAAVLVGNAGHADTPAGHRTSARNPRGIVVHVVQTTADLSQRIKRLPDMWMRPGEVHGPMIVQVRDGVRYQPILGFGGGLSDSSAWLIHHELTTSARNEVMRGLFGSDGIHLNFVRLPMGASDFSAGTKPFTYDDVPPGQSDPGLEHFSLAHDLRYIIPTLRQARAIDPGVFVIASPWTAPAWMKTNQRLDNFGNAGDFLPVGYGAYAAYFVRFLQGYRSHGVSVDAVTPQNEPGVANTPSMNFSEPDEATFVAQYLGPALGAARLPTQVYGLDDGWDMLSSYADPLATGPAGRYLSGISWHCYWQNPTAMTQFHALAPRLIQVVSECSPEVRGFPTAEALIGSLRNWASAVALWNLALNPAHGPVLPPGTWCRGCRGLVAINETTHQARPQLSYYQLGQVSKFVARGAVHIGANTFVTDETNAHYIYQPTVGLDDVAFINPSGERVLVTYNNSRHSIQFELEWHQHALLYRQRPGAMTTFTWR